MGRTPGTWICNYCRRANPLTQQSQDGCLHCLRLRCRKCGKQGLGVIRNDDGKKVLTENNMFGRTAHSLTCLGLNSINQTERNNGKISR